MLKQKEILFVLWMTFITVVAWIGFNIYHIMVTSTISEELQAQTLPIDPNFDMETINNLKIRQKVEPLYQYRGGSEDESATTAASVPTGAVEEAVQGGGASEVVQPEVSEAP